MSRIGKVPVYVPEGVKLELDQTEIKISGPLGALTLQQNRDLEISVVEDQIIINPRSPHARSIWGTYRTLIQQMVTGVTQGYTLNLELVGVGYRAIVENQDLVLKLGFSHDIRHTIPEGVKIVCQKPTFLSVIGINKQKVHQEAAKIRSYKKPEPYKGKGILYENEIIIRKEGKKK